MPEPDTMTTPAKSYVYFKNLDGLRAIAAFMVVLSHVEYHKNLFGLREFGFFNFENFGKIGVTIFFALSGFLISYLLLEEKNKFKKVHLKDFYIRRILRIWPLYFLLVIVGFFIYPAQGSSTGLVLSVFFLPNLAFCMSLLPVIFDPIWSIGTEEQFYIFHPHIFRIKKVEHIFYTMVGLTIGLITLTVIVRAAQYINIFFKYFSLFLYYARFDDMLIGAIIALLYYNTRNKSFDFKFQRLFNLLFNKYVQAATYILLAAFIYLFLLKVIPQGDIVIALLTAVIIANLCEPSTSLLSFRNQKLIYCGKISYGIYLLHKYPLFLMLYVVKTFMPSYNFLLQNVVLYLGTIMLVVILASISYYGYERYFLRLKARFQRVTQTKSN